MAKWRVNHKRTLECVVTVEADTADAAAAMVQEGEVAFIDVDVLGEEVEVDDVTERADA